MGITPKSVYEQFSEKQKNEIINLFYAGKTHREIGGIFGCPRRTVMKLCKHLGLKRTRRQAANLKGKSKLDNETTIEKIKSMRNAHSLAQIAKECGGSQSAVDRICRKNGIVLDKIKFAEMQSQKMKKLWTPDKCKAISGSIYPELNDKEWLENQYKKMSMGKLAKLIGAPLSSVSHHLKRHGIKLRSKEEYLRNLRRKSATKRIAETKWGTFYLQADQEYNFIMSLDKSTKSVKYEQTVFKYRNSQYVVDFEINGEYVEIKPPEYARFPGVNRQKFIKQFLIAQANGVDLKCWYKGKYFDYDPINDLDRYFCLNWKLLFPTPGDCFKFLHSYGFKPLEWFKDKLLYGLNSVFSPGESLNANYPNTSVMSLIKHFSPHFWSSTHNGYNSIADAFGDGNNSILKSAVYKLWDKKRNVNIYGLVKIITKHFKDFAAVSIFKPWVARTVYDKYLPAGGVIIDPCMGWGGRLLGILDSSYKYIGYDLNPNAIQSHHNLRKFIGSRMTIDPEFYLADSSEMDFIIFKGDLLFTSPPYDDCELYDGINSYITKTKPILENIFNKFNGIVALNLPKRQKKMCVETSKKYGYTLIDELEMKTSSFMGREKTYEPILVFKKLGVNNES